jgi:hypothetical protein
LEGESFRGVIVVVVGGIADEGRGTTGNGCAMEELEGDNDSDDDVSVWDDGGRC